MTSPLLSIIIPALNEEARLPDTLDKILAYLAQQPYQAEIIVVENGSTDRTLAIAQDYAARLPSVHALHSERGKGSAVRAGMLAAQGDYRFICDADLSMPIEQVTRFLPPNAPEAEICIGSREAPGSVRHNEPAYRHFTGRGFNTLVRWLLLPGLQDTQCGVKCFRGDVAEDVFRLQTITGWTFDVEVLYIARLHGSCIVEIPVDWYHNPGSKIRVLHDSWVMFSDLLKIRRNAWRGLYRHAPLSDS